MSKKSSRGITLQRINNVKVQVIKKKNEDNRPILGEKLFPSTYPNICLLAKKKSGKTTIIYNIIRECAGKGGRTKVVVFSSSLSLDSTWDEIKRYCEKHDIPFHGEHVIYDKVKKINYLAEFLKKMEENLEKDQEEKELSEDESSEEGFFSDSDASRSSEEYTSEEDDITTYKKHVGVERILNKATSSMRDKRDDFQCPKYIIVFDDIPGELRDKEIASFSCRNRHHKALVCYAGHSSKNVYPSGLHQMDYVLLWNGLDEKGLEHIRQKCGLDIDFENFLRIYRHATKEPHAFLYCNTADKEFRKNFDQKYTIYSENKDGKL